MLLCPHRSRFCSAHDEVIRLLGDGTNGLHGLGFACIQFSGCILVRSTPCTCLHICLADECKDCPIPMPACTHPQAHTHTAWPMGAGPRVSSKQGMTSPELS